MLPKLSSFYTNNKRYKKFTLAKIFTIADEGNLAKIAQRRYVKNFHLLKPYTEDEIIMDVMRHKKPSGYWMPRIALTTGMRVIETLQLLVKDVGPSIGVRRKPKTSNSVRKVPILNVLIVLGLLEFVSSREGRCLFPCVTRSHDGNYIYRKRFNWMISRLIMKPEASLNPLKNFHSFRDTFRANCREYGVSNEQENLIGGWRSNLSPTTGDRYGKKFEVFLGKLTVSIDLIVPINLTWYSTNEWLALHK